MVEANLLLMLHLTVPLIKETAFINALQGCFLQGLHTKTKDRSETPTGYKGMR